MSNSASELAKYIIATHHADGKPVTNLKLQKLLYYCQAWHLAIKEKPLFGDRIEAWVHGPVVPGVFREYRDFRWSPLPPNSAGELGADVQGHIDEVLEAYGKFDASQLERLTHEEDPWKDARKGIPADMPSTCEITHEAMSRYYRARLNG